MAKSGINQKKAAEEFAEFWKNKGGEKQHTQVFWLSLLRDVLGVSKPEKYIDFEKRVKINGTKYIDAYIAQTNVAIEQKSEEIDLDRKEMQSDGSMLTPYEQAKRYNDNLRYSERCRWIVVSNFYEIRIYDMESDEPEKHFETVLVKDLDKDFARLQFLIDHENAAISREVVISLKAGELVGRLYDAILKQYKNPESAETLKSLNILCVRLVFLLYAEDAGIFPGKDMFGRYLAKFRPEEVREKILNLFSVLNTKPKDRDPYLSDDLAAFPYVNGGLFAEQKIEIPRFNEEIVDMLVNKASACFDWSEISPTIFGAVFESTLNPETRRKGGMHYTSLENIHRVIDPLFRDDLKAEFEKIVKTCRGASLKSKLEDFRNKLASLKFLDPACGSGNFLTETYISLRRLENECLKVIHGDQMLLSSKDFSPIKVKISQFYGIEINDFAVTVAKTALWIAESQMMRETEEIVEQNLDFLPLSTSATIVEGNALRMDWRYLHEEAEIPTIKAKKTNLMYPMMVKEKDVEYGEINLITNEINVGKPQRKQDANHYDYIMGNPPFVGARFMDQHQKEDVIAVFGKNWHGVGDLDYVACWYKQAFDIIKGTQIRCAFVSTNSITQGAAVANLWKPLFSEGIQFDFAWRTFRWDSESTKKANVHCVIIGFSSGNAHKPHESRPIFNPDWTIIEAKNINPYLIDAPNVFVGSRQHPLADVPEIGIGNKPIDGGNYLFTEDEMKEFIRKEPASETYFRKWIGSDEFINRYRRYCLWLGDCSPAEIKKMPECYKRVQAVKEFRLASKSVPTRKLADTPTRFHVENFPKGNYILIPRVSSEKRKYIPIGFVESGTLCSDSVHVLDCSQNNMKNSSLFIFGILTSSIHNAWNRAVCGRLKSDYRYSKDIVYNNFPWPDLSDCCAATSPNRRGKDIKAKIEETAQAILDARAKYPDSSLANLYDETLMPPELRKAHKENDKAVMQAYGFNLKMSESEIVAELFKMYEKLTMTR